MVDAAQIIADDARIIAAVLGNEILQPQGPLGLDHDTEVPLRLLVVLQPRDVRLGIAHARASQSHHTTGGLHHRKGQVVAGVEGGRAVRNLVVVLVTHDVDVDLLVQIRVQLFAVYV